ncbi:MAG: prepilin-type N-terminal cleavage/methylation domain-containing protein [Phycisphaeraceae bacterium]|nr:prepilin-type N-terminal cleavage/methylation domain-containing protein [Phycisphaeraceae bacterium]
MRKSRGFLLMELLIAMAVVLLALGMLAMLGTQQRRADQRLSERRSAARWAEATLQQLRQSPGQSPGHAPGEVPGQVKAMLPSTVAADVTPLGNMDAAPGWRWVKVTCTVGRTSAEMVGVVPVSHVTGKEVAP